MYMHCTSRLSELRLYLIVQQTKIKICIYERHLKPQLVPIGPTLEPTLKFLPWDYKIIVYFTRK